MSNCYWIPIEEFESLAEFKRFEVFLQQCVEAGGAKEIPADPEYSRGEIYGGRWFIDTKTGCRWRLIEPDIPFKGLWEQVEQLN